MDDTINYLSSHGITFLKEGEKFTNTGNSTLGAKYGMLWLDVEGTSYWSSSASNNVNFLQGMVNEGKARGVSLGIYSSASQWNPIMGGSTAFKSLPLWYAHYDYNPSFSDFSSFGGWTSPAIKQYAGDQSFCSCSVDKNYY
jgi:GH25 family lysozyme M1 (1,4-beta-N-acetylmuramidase)